MCNSSREDIASYLRIARRAPDSVKHYWLREALKVADRERMRAVSIKTFNHIVRLIRNLPATAFGKS